MNQPVLKTLDRILSKAGLGSRTEARSWIGSGRVSVNGRVIQTPDHWVNPLRDKVLLDGKPLERVERRYILLYKPKGYLTTYRDPEGRKTVYDLLPKVNEFVGTVGRLDLDTSGLLLLTNDNDLAEYITNPEHHVSKMYMVKASTVLTTEQLDQLRNGVTLDDGPTRPAQVTPLRNTPKYSFIEITISEGRNRQVRRMLEAVGSKVLKLVRVRLGPLSLTGLRIGEWRDLTPAEIAMLRPSAKAKRKS